MTTARLETFSDGVFAIAATLLILNVSVSGVPLDKALVHGWPSYVAYAVSFLTIGIMWVNHHGVLSNSQELWMRNRDQAATDPVLLVVSVLDSLLSCSLPSMKVAPARTSGTSSWPLIRRQRAWAASSSL